MGTDDDQYRWELIFKMPDSPGRNGLIWRYAHDGIQTLEFYLDAYEGEG